jgi:TDG/mug DNA glycosylase family protein
MLRLVQQAAPGAALVQADLTKLPFRPGSLIGAWASMSYHHLPRAEVPLALARLHRSMATGAPLDITTVHGDYEGRDLPDDDFPGRWFGCWTEEPLRDVLVGAGFSVDEVGRRGPNLWAAARRAHTLADTVGPDMSVLVCGLNPSLHAAASGVGYSGPGNRFWPCAVEAGLVSRADPEDALARHGVGMTDLVKRATPRAAELTTAELRVGMDRVERLVGWLAPRVVAFVGLQGWRSAVDRRAQPGWQPRDLAGRPVYVLPSTSGLNAATPRESLVRHLATVAHGRP